MLFAALEEKSVRLKCADILGQFCPAKATRFFHKIAQRELESNRPDSSWLNAAIHATGYSDLGQATELLVSIFERGDLPGTIRGDAGDKLGCCEFDRRTRLYRRCRDAVIRGLSEDSIHIQFWSMYVIASLCNVAGSRQTIDRAFRSALPRLREIAKHDHRLAPGYWWPMSAEAEDAISCMQNGIFPEVDAAERWRDNSTRGVWDDD